MALELILYLLIGRVSAHSRWACPDPRSESTGIKTAVCGSESNDFTGELFATIKPGPLTVVFEESIAHRGSPWRISLSMDGNDDESCVLLDHIPHDEYSSPFYGIESTYHLFKITIDIPDVLCERCSLHLANPMTDKIGGDGAPGAKGCTDPDGTCFSVYHSCTRPFRIEGSTPRSQYQCPGQPKDWPTNWVGDGGETVDASIPGLYRRESAEWDSDHWLKSVPVKYKTPAGELCPVDAPATTSTLATNMGDAMISHAFTISSLFIRRACLLCLLPVYFV